MNQFIGVGALALGAGLALGGISDDFEGYAIGGLPGGVWQDAAHFIDNPTNDGDSISVIQTVDAFGNSTRAVQIGDQIGTSGGMMASIDTASMHRFEMDLRFDQRSNGSPINNWMGAVGFVQDTNQADFNSSPQAYVYSGANGRFQLFVQNGDGQGASSRNFALGNAMWSLDTWYRVSLAVDTENGIFDAMVTDIASGEVVVDFQRIYSGWNAEFGQYDLLSVSDGEYGTALGTIPNKSTFDNANYVPVPGGVAVMAVGGLLSTRRQRASKNS